MAHRVRAAGQGNLYSVFDKGDYVLQCGVIARLTLAEADALVEKLNSKEEVKEAQRDSQ